MPGIWPPASSARRPSSAAAAVAVVVAAAAAVVVATLSPVAELSASPQRPKLKSNLRNKNFHISKKKIAAPAPVGTCRQHLLLRQVREAPPAS